ncbi:MAG TPA: tRNA 2-selenouridine(34) synthase MnmH [Flavilitoribacter sp.]|nr:tRNA 2-selenouridine(34) synthase MnmH [Flavilitoribacter sp.]
MAVKTDPEKLPELLADRVLFDVRTPAEFDAGHIPGAVNLPLFTNEERAEIGTIYKQVDPRLAFLRGLELVGPKMRQYVEQASASAPDLSAVVHCWRGGQRSESMGWLLEKSGFDITVLNGGYKAFRRHALEYLCALPHPLIVLGGYTGSGKTEVLHVLKRKGERVVDLEGLARHKGSAFGALGELPQPTVEQFENDLWAAFREIPSTLPVWVEDESRSIGRVYQPDGFWRNLLSSTLIQVIVPVELRVERLVREYGAFPKEDLAESFVKISKRIGGQHVKAALEAISRDDLSTAAHIALQYYDKTYQHTLERPGRGKIIRLEVDTNDPEVIAARVMEAVLEAGD